MVFISSIYLVIYNFDFDSAFGTFEYPYLPRNHAGFTHSVAALARKWVDSEVSHPLDCRYSLWNNPHQLLPFNNRHGITWYDYDSSSNRSRYVQLVSSSTRHSIQEICPTSSFNFQSTSGLTDRLNRNLSTRGWANMETTVRLTFWDQLTVSRWKLIDIYLQQRRRRQAFPQQMVSLAPSAWALQLDHLSHMLRSRRGCHFGSMIKPHIHKDLQRSLLLLPLSGFRLPDSQIVKLNFTITLISWDTVLDCALFHQWGCLAYSSHFIPRNIIHIGVSNSFSLSHFQLIRHTDW